MHNPQDFASRIKYLRLRCSGLTLEEFAERVGVSPGYLSKLERGVEKNPSTALINSVCAVFHVRKDWLQSGSGEVLAEVKATPEQIAETFFTSNTVQPKRTAEGWVLEIKPHKQSSALTDVPTSEIIEPEMRTMEALLETIRALTKARGKQSALANFLGVSPSRVSEWLSGKCEPDGRKTLQLLEWVRQEKRTKL